MPNQESLETERYVLLANQLGEQLGKRRGWQAKVARKLGISPSHLSKLLSGRAKGVGADAIDEALRRLSLLPSFFTDESDEEPLFSDYQVTEAVASAALRSIAEAANDSTREWDRIAERATELLRQPEAITAEDRLRVAAMVLSTEVVLMAMSLLQHPDQTDQIAELLWIRRYARRMAVGRRAEELASIED